MPNTTSPFSYKDYLFRKLFYHPFANGNQGRGLTFEGYFRAVTPYGGEQNLITRCKSCTNSFAQWRQDNPDLLRSFRRQARDIHGYTHPYENTRYVTFFWGQDYFAFTENISHAKREFDHHPQPGFCSQTNSRRT